MPNPTVGKPQGIRLDATVNNIPSSYNETAGSKLISGVPTTLTHISIDNVTASDIAVDVLAGDTGSTAAVDRIFIPSNTNKTFDNVVISSRVYIRSLSGAPIVAGKVNLTVW